MSRGTDTYNIESYKEFCKELGVKDPDDPQFMSKCVLFFKNKGHREDDANSICYIGFQEKFRQMEMRDDALNEDNKFYDNPRSLEKRRITFKTLMGQSKTGRKKRKDAGRRKSKIRYKTDRNDTFEECVEMLMDNGYPREDAIKIAAKIMLGIQDRVEKGVAGNISARLANVLKGGEEELEPIPDDPEVEEQPKKESFLDKLDGVFLTEKKKKKKKKKKSRKKSSTWRGPVGGAYYDNDSGDIGGDIGGGE
jgi:hypothetical protein